MNKISLLCTLMSLTFSGIIEAKPLTEGQRITMADFTEFAKIMGIDSWKVRDQYQKNGNGYVWRQLLEKYNIDTQKKIRDWMASR